MKRIIQLTLNVRHPANVWLTQQQVAVVQYEGSTQDPCGVIATMYLPQPFSIFKALGYMSIFLVLSDPPVSHFPFRICKNYTPFTTSGTSHLTNNSTLVGMLSSMLSKDLIIWALLQSSFIRSASNCMYF